MEVHLVRRSNKTGKPTNIRNRSVVAAAAAAGAFIGDRRVIRFNDDDNV